MTKKVLFEDYTKSDRYIPPPAYRETTQIATRRRVVFDDEKQSLSESVSMFLMGTDRRRNTWYRWHTNTAKQVRRTKNGKFVNTQMFSTALNSKGKQFFSDRPQIWVEVYDPGPRVHNFQIGFYAQDLFQTKFEVQDVYPMSDAWNIARFGQIPTGMPELKVDNPRDFVERVFGKRNYRKDLVKAVFNTQSPTIVNLAASFKGLVPIDWIINFLRKNAEFAIPYQDYQVIEEGTNQRLLKRVLPYYTPQDWRRLLNSEIVLTDLYNLDDYIRRYVRLLRPADAAYFVQRNQERNPIRIRRFRDLHDQMFGRRGIMAAHVLQYDRSNYGPETPIPITPTGEKIAARGLFTIPNTVRDLYEWGEKMHNCIASYAPDVMRKDSKKVLGAAVYNDKIVANFEVHNGTLNQLLGPCNQTLSTEIRTLLEFEFREAGVTIPNHYWGKA